MPPDTATTPHERDAILWHRWRDDGDGRALEALLALHEPLVRSAARRAARTMPGADLDDLKQCGRVALWQCATTWDPVHGVALAGYARRAVELACLRGLQQQQPTADASLDDTVPGAPDTHGLTLGEVLADPDSVTHADRLDDDAGRTAIREAIDRLPERTREIVQARCFQDPPVPLGVLAAIYRIGAPRVSQIEQAGYAQIVATAREMLAATRRGRP